MNTADAPDGTYYFDQLKLKLWIKIKGEWVKLDDFLSPSLEQKKTMNITNELTKAPDPHPIHVKHWFLHGANATLVLTLSICAHIWITDIRAMRQRKATHSVQWFSGQFEREWKQDTNCFPGPTRSGSPIEIGALDDGTIVWRRAVKQ